MLMIVVSLILSSRFIALENVINMELLLFTIIIRILIRRDVDDSAEYLQACNRCQLIPRFSLNRRDNWKLF